MNSRLLLLGSKRVLHSGKFFSYIVSYIVLGNSSVILAHSQKIFSGSGKQFLFQMGSSWFIDPPGDKKNPISENQKGKNECHPCFLGKEGQAKGNFLLMEVPL